MLEGRKKKINLHKKAFCFKMSSNLAAVSVTSTGDSLHLGSVCVLNFSYSMDMMHMIKIASCISLVFLFLDALSLPRSNTTGSLSEEQTSKETPQEEARSCRIFVNY